MVGVISSECVWCHLDSEWQVRIYIGDDCTDSKSVCSACLGEIVQEMMDDSANPDRAVIKRIHHSLLGKVIMSVRDPRLTQRVLLSGSVNELDVTSYEDATVLERRDTLPNTNIRHSVWMDHDMELDHVIRQLTRIRNMRPIDPEISTNPRWCARCTDFMVNEDKAEVAGIGVIHASCMLEGEVIA